MFDIISVAGGIICGLCLAQANAKTSWMSWLGLWSVVGLVCLACGLLGLMYGLGGA